MPPVLDPQDIYAADRPNQLSPAVRNFPSRIYVPNSESNSVDVIDPATFHIIDHFEVGQQPQHIVPSYDLKTLWVLDDKGDGLTRIDPATGKKGETVPVQDPYNLYFTPDGEDAIVVAESLHRLDFRDPRTMNLKYSLPVPCDGVNHLDFSADGRYLIASCEFDGKLLKIDVTSRTVLATLQFGRHSMPQDVRLSPDGRIFYVADMGLNGVHEIDGSRFSQIALSADWKRRARSLRQPRFQVSLHLQPRRRKHFRAGLREAKDRQEMAHPARRQSGHGRSLSRRECALARRPL